MVEFPIALLQEKKEEGKQEKKKEKKEKNAKLYDLQITAEMETTPNRRLLIRDGMPHVQFIYLTDGSCAICEAIRKWLVKYAEAKKLVLEILPYQAPAIPMLDEDEGGEEEEKEEEEEGHHRLIYVPPEDPQMRRDIRQRLSPRYLLLDTDIKLEKGDKKKLSVEKLIERRLLRLFHLSKPCKPLPHQKILINYFRENNGKNWQLGAFFINWGKGAGKTLGVQLVLQHAPIPYVVIVCNNTMIEYWADSVYPIQQASSSSSRSWMVFDIIGYTELNRHLEILEGRKNIVVVDESQYYRNMTPLMQQVLNSFQHTYFTFLLSGSVALNDPLEVLSLVRLMKQPFNNQDEAKFERKDYGFIDTTFRNRVYSYDPSLIFKDKFPTRIETITPVPMTLKQTVEYIMKSKQNVTLGNATFTTSYRNSYGVISKGISSGLRKFKQIVYDTVHMKRYPQVIYSPFLDHGIFQIAKMLKEAAPDLRVEVLTGQTPALKRQGLVRQLNKQQIDVLLISNVGNVGLDLHGVAALRLAGVHDTFEAEQQTIGRVARYESHVDAPFHEVEIAKYISTFPDIQPDTMNVNSDEARIALKYFRENFAPVSPSNARKFFRDLKTIIHRDYHNQTIDERMELNNRTKHQQIVPIERQIKLLSISS